MANFPNSLPNPAAWQTNQDFADEIVAMSTYLQQTVGPAAVFNTEVLATNVPYSGAPSAQWRYPTSGKVLLARLDIRKNVTPSVVTARIINAMVTPTTGQNFMGFYDNMGNLLAASADLSTAFSTAGGTLTVSISGCRAINATEKSFWVGILQNSTTNVNWDSIKDNLGYTMSWAGGSATKRMSLATTNSTAFTALPATIDFTTCDNNNVNGLSPILVVT